MGRGTWYYSLGVSSIVDAFVRSEFGISSWRGSRVDGRSYLLSGAIDGSEANRIIRDSKLEFENSRGVRVARKDDRGVSEGREDVREVFQQRRSGAKRKLSRCGRNQMGNEPILALPEGADDFVVLMKDYMTNMFDFEAKYHLGKANVDVVPWNKTSKAKNASTWDVAWLGPTSVKRYGEWFILVRQGSDLHLERCKDLGYRIGVYDKIFYPSWSGYDGVVLG
ncbi:hypothetical protein Tco_0809221 [Tanacetum coccineum]